MKKTLLTLTALIAVTLGNQAQTLKWHHTLDSNPAAGDNAIELAQAADGTCLVLNMWASCEAGVQPGTMYQNAPADFMHYYIDGQLAKDDKGNEITGSLYKISDGTSCANNIALQKVDPLTGEIKWIVYTDRGGENSSYEHIVPTKDGGCLMQLYFRHWAQDQETTLIRINGTNGTQQELKTDEGLWTDDNGNPHSYFVPVLVKISSDGRVEWAKTLWKIAPVKGLKNAPSWLSFTESAAIDDDENIYVCGNYRTTLTFDNGTAVTPTNGIAGWNGDDQATIGDLYIVKFDKNGNYLKHLVSGGTAANAFAMNMVVEGGKVYITGHVTGNGGKLTLGGKELTPGTEGQDMLVAGLDTDLQVEWARIYNNVKNIGALHLEALQYQDGALWQTGSLLSNTNGGNGAGLADDNGRLFVEPATKIHEGMIIKMNPQNGDVMAAGCNQNTYGISKYDGIFFLKDADGKPRLMVSGYEWNRGTVLFSMEEDDATRTISSNKEASTVLLDRGDGQYLGTNSVNATPMVDTASGMVVFMNRFGRANTANFSARYFDGTETHKVNCWSTALYGVKFDNLFAPTTAIQRIPVSHPSTDALYNLNGQRVAPGTKGILIKNGKKVIF